MSTVISELKKNGKDAVSLIKERLKEEVKGSLLKRLRAPVCLDDD